MGQAKLRGSREQRVAQALLERQEEPPINIPCKTCGEVLNGFTFLKAVPEGAFWQKSCMCGALTTALVQHRHSRLDRTFKSALTVKDEITQGDPRVSVTFLEKTLDTVETGIIRLG